MQGNNSDRPVHVIACGVLAADITHVTRQLGVPTTMEFLPGGLHARPQELRRQLQERIDRASAGFRGDRIIVGCGVCGLGTVGLFARNVPLAIPRVNDCIALFLGSDAAYREQFARYPGTYYISAGWVDEKAHPQASGESPIQCGPECFTLGQLVRRFGEENAEAIRDFLHSWQRNYQRAAYIETGVSERGRHYAQLAAAMARQFGWKYEELPGSHDLLTGLITSVCPNDQVLLVPPHHVTTHDPVNRLLQAVPVWKRASATNAHDFTLVLDGHGDEKPTPAAAVKRGLGIDVGGTFTDVVLYDFVRDEVVAAAKSQTTKWDFTLGIGKALDALAATHALDVDLVSISTTLATNAVVENRGQKVGLLIFPPYSLWERSHVPDPAQQLCVGGERRDVSDSSQRVDHLRGQIDLCPVRHHRQRDSVRRLLRGNVSVRASALSAAGSLPAGISEVRSSPGRAASAIQTNRRTICCPCRGLLLMGEDGSMVVDSTPVPRFPFLSPSRHGRRREWVEAARVAHTMEHNRMGVMGHYYGGMPDIYSDLTQQCASFGGHVEMIEVDELAVLRAEVNDDDLYARVAHFAEAFDVQPDCPPAELECAARTSVALDRLVERHRLGSLAYYYMGTGNAANEDAVSSIILGTSLLTARGVPVAGEMEIKNVQAMKILDGFGAGGSFTEYYAMDYRDDVVLMGHDGPGHIAITQGKTNVRPLLGPAEKREPVRRAGWYQLIGCRFSSTSLVSFRGLVSFER